MATFKALILPRQKRQDNTYNVKIRVSHQRDTKYISTPWYAKERELDRNMNIKSYRLIDYTNELIQEYIEKCELLGHNLTKLSVDELVEFLTESDEEPPFELDFVKYTRDYIAKLKETGHSGTSTCYQAAINSLVRYAGKEVVDISEITTKFINGWMKWIMETPTPKGKCGGRAPSLYAAAIKAMHNRAKLEFNDEDEGIVNIRNSPFAKAIVPKPGETRKRALTVEQIRAIMSFPIPKEAKGGRMELAKDAFLLSFFLVGMNAVDLFNATHFDGKRLTYERTKTRTRRSDRAEISIMVEPEVKPLMKKYADKRQRRVFSFYRRYSTSNNLNSALNKGLKQLGEALGIDNLEFYAARHSWATIAVNDAGIDKYTVHEALNHVDPAMKVTDIYIKKNWSKIDRANRKVIDLIMEEPEPKSGRATNKRATKSGQSTSKRK